jgi:hypothetical protein
VQAAGHLVSGSLNAVKYGLCREVAEGFLAGARPANDGNPAEVSKDSGMLGSTEGTRVPSKGEPLMMLNWNEYMKEIQARSAELARTSPEIIRGYRTLSDAGQKTGKLDAKTRELIALAVAVSLR